MKQEFKFAVYTAGTSQQKRKTYRVIHTGAGYIIQVYMSDVHFWDDVYDKSVRFENLTEVFKSKQFKDLFIKNK